MDKIYNRYIRLIHSNAVARCIGEHNANKYTPKLYAFMDVTGVIRYADTIKFISTKEYFAEVLKGNEFNDDVRY